jgi:isoaspartyl peptidase/L-asparaginase-like protein (Ntn-hydrolase superfamily)
MAADLLAAAENPAQKPEDCRWGLGWGTHSTIAASGGGDAQSVANACVRKLAHRAHTTGGLILLDRNGNPAAAFNTSRMAYGFVNPDDSFTIAP